MAELERRGTAVAPARVEQTQVPATTEFDHLPAMFGRLGDDVMRMLDAKLGLIKLELKEEASVYTRSVAFIAVGGVLAAIGFAFANIAVAFFISKLFVSFGAPLSYALGFIITGALYLVIGGAIILAMKKRLAAHDPAPTRSLEELRKDKQWLKNDI
ncbi:MAG: hypothetical protein DMF64_14735 [Acidobacteria bacterium]|nr:MAG: hypothetical protein DMF64_14735 [Acidobacteriota bacterium]